MSHAHSNNPTAPSVGAPSEEQAQRERCALADGSVFWTDALDPAHGAKIIAVYPSGSTVDFTATARKTTEGRDRNVYWVGDLRAKLRDALDIIEHCHPNWRANQSRKELRKFCEEARKTLLPPNVEMSNAPLSAERKHVE